jgi:SnoaL-like domain
MTTQEVAKKLTDLCKQGKFIDAIEALYSKDIVSVEAAPMPDGSREMKGLDAVMGKSKWWVENHEVHGGTVEGPLATDTHFTVRMTFDATFKPTGKRTTLDELCVYEVKDGKIVREEFFYGM